MLYGFHQVVAEGVPGSKWVIRNVFRDVRMVGDLGEYRTPLGKWISNRDRAEKFNDIQTLKRSIPPGYLYLGSRPTGQRYKTGELQYTPD